MHTSVDTAPVPARPGEHHAVQGASFLLGARGLFSEAAGRRQAAQVQHGPIELSSGDDEGGAEPAPARAPAQRSSERLSARAVESTAERFKARSFWSSAQPHARPQTLGSCSSSKGGDSRARTVRIARDLQRDFAACSGAVIAR